MTASVVTKNLFRLPALLVAVWLILAGSANSASDDLSPATATPGRNETEQWVISQIESGQVTDMERHFPDDASKRILRAGFLEELLTGVAVPIEKTRRRGVRLTGAIFDEPVDLSSDLVGCAVQFQDCHFKRDANFDRTVFADNVAFSRCEFLGSANFHSTKIGGNALFDQTLFSGPARFSGSSVSGYFFVDQAQFLNLELPVDFSGLKIGLFASFDNAVFSGSAKFNGADMTGSFSAKGVKFQNKDSFVSFIDLKVGSGAYFTQAIFAGETSFTSARITDTFSLDGTHFTHPEKTAGFVNLKVAHNFSLVGTVFDGPVDFNSAEVGAFLIVNDARFQSHDKRVSFLNIKVGATAYFGGTVFSGPVNLGDSSFLNLYVTTPTLVAEPTPEFGLTNVTVKQDLHLERLHIRDLIASSLRVEGSTALIGLQVDHKADLSYGNFANLDLGGSRWPAPKTGEFLLRGANYKYISAARDEADSHENLLALVDQAAYTADVYANLEAFFVRQGYREDADRAYVASRARERRESMNWYSFRFYWNRVLQGIGYGRYPERALYACMAVVALGCWLFKPQRMQRQPTEDGKRAVHYNRFWYSLENFLPLVELKAADAWEPKPTERFLRHYMRIHTLLGWILIPIGLASVAGVIK